MSTQPQSDTYQTPEHGWTCFHCGEHFEPTLAGQKSAQLHFGETPNTDPACLIKLSSEDRTLLWRFRWLESEVERLQNDINDETTSSQVFFARMESAIKSFKPFRECRSMHDVFNIYDSMEGRALAAEERLGLKATPPDKEEL